MILLICVLVLINGSSACMKTVPGDVPHIDDPVCDNCAAATDLTCPQEYMCDFSYLKRTKNGAQCSTYSCSKGQMIAYISLVSSAVDSAVCDTNSQLVWKTETGEVYGKTLQATCAFPCATCSEITTVTSPCSVGYDCTAKTDSLTYSADSHGCLTAKCAKGQMFSKGQPVSQASCIGGAYTVSGKAASQIACGTPCDACTALLNDGLTCPDGHTCTTVSEREGQCSEAYCPSGIMTADGVEVDSLTCNGQSQWVDAGGTTYTAAQCELSCLLCTTLTNTGMACPEGLICSPPSEKEDGCKETYCPTGTMTASSERTSVTSLTCNGQSQWVDDEKTVFTSAQCETPCGQCTALTNTGMTCATGFVCTAAVSQAGQCPVMACTEGEMKANPGNVAVTSLSCDGSAQWIDSQSAVYTAAQCESSCTQCATPTNTGMPCPEGLLCVPAQEREGQCSEIYCASGTLTGNADRTSVTLLTCNTAGVWVDTQAATYTTAQCETPCDQCTALTNTGMTCPTGFICTAATSQSGQCPVMTCSEGEMKANPGNVAVTSLSCDGTAQWIDSQSAVYTAAQCESSCTQCAAPTNTGMLCPKGLLCVPAQEREGQCSEIYCASGTLTGNADRTSLTLLTCNTAGVWVDTQAATYTTAQCETPCDQCTSLLNTGMACLSGFRCKAVLTRSTGQCPEVYCDTGLMTAGSGRTTVTQLSCNGLSQWVDPAGAVYSIAQCETGCTCPALPVTASPSRLFPTRGRDLDAGDGGCSTLSAGCSENERYRLVTSNGVVTMEPPAAQTTQMSCVSGQWITTINGVQTVVQQQACYLFSCTLCPAVIGGTGVTVTIGYNPTTWCKLYTLSGCANGYRVATVTGSRTITGPLTCDALLRWGSGSFNGNVGQAVTVNCVL